MRLGLAVERGRGAGSGSRLGSAVERTEALVG